MLWDSFARTCAAHGPAVALAQGAISWTFDELFALALRISDALPVGPGDCVLVMLDNEPRAAALLPALWRRGATAVFMHANPPESHFAHAVARARPALIVTDTSDEARGSTTIDALVDAGPAAGRSKPPPLGSGEIASITFTSGSTGTPKGVMQSAANLVDGPQRIARLMRYGPGDIILNPVPLAFDYGLGQLLSLIVTGVPLILPRVRSGQGVCEAIEQHRPTVIAAYPSLLGELALGLAPTRETVRDSVRLITSTGSRIPAPVFGAAIDVFPDAAFSLNYGLTETYRTASLPPELARAHPDSVGHAIQGVSIDIRRPDGSRAAPDEEGEIVHRGAGAFVGYWADEARTAEVLRPDPELGPDAPPVVYTGDLGRVDSNGLLYFHGRRDRQIKCMGAIVSPDEVESLLLASGLVREAAVTSQAHDILGEVVIACLVPPVATGLHDARAWLRQLRRYCRDTMGPYMQPRRFEVVEGFPRTRSGKVDYPALRRLIDGQVPVGEGEILR